MDRPSAFAEGNSEAASYTGLAIKAFQGDAAPCGPVEAVARGTLLWDRARHRISRGSTRSKARPCSILTCATTSWTGCHDPCARQGLQDICKDSSRCPDCAATTVAIVEATKIDLTKTPLGSDEFLSGVERRSAPSPSRRKPKAPLSGTSGRADPALFRDRAFLYSGPRPRAAITANMPRVSLPRIPRHRLGSM